MADGKRRYKSDRKDYKISVKLSEKDMDILKVALKRTGMTASAYIRELIRTGGNIDTSYPEDRARVIRVIAGIANNINQAVKLGNSQGKLYYSDIDKLQSSLDDIKKTFGEHMHGHLIWNSVSMTTGKKYNSPKSNWKNHLQPITNKYCDELGLSIMPAEYSRNPKNISRDKWEKEMSMKEIILRDAKMCAYAAGNVEHFKYLMKRLGYVFKKDAWMEVQAPGFRYYHKLAKLDEMFSEDMLRHYVDMPWMAKPYFYSSDIRGLHRAKLSPFQKKFYAKLYRLRIVEQKRFAVGGAKYTEDLKRFHQLQDEYLLIVNNDIKSVVDLVDFINEQEEKIQQIEDRQHEIYRESSSRKRSIKNEEQYREYQIWHMEVQEELDELKQEKREIKRQIQLADDIIKEDLYTAYYAVSGNEEIVADRDVEIPGMEEKTAVEEVAAVVVEPDANVQVMNPGNNQNEIGRQREQVDSARKQETDVKGKSEFVEPKEKEPMDKVGWIVRRISELGGCENVSDSVKADIFGFDIADVSGSIRLFSDVMKRLGIKLDGDGLYEEFQRIYDESVIRNADKHREEPIEKNRVLKGR